jgi:hypothetical protein
MLLEELIDMRSPNTLAALAYIKENENPFVVFCNYILYTLALSTENPLRYDEITERISSEFSLRLPPQIMKTCIRILKNDKKIAVLPRGAGYSAEKDSFDLSGFSAKREIYRRDEESLIRRLMDFVKGFQQTWEYGEAREYLTDFLLVRQNAAKLFVEGTVSTVEKDKHIFPMWYVGKFISDALKSSGVVSAYLLRIVSGLMIYIGVYQIEEYRQEKDQKFRGTDFYVDTKLLLRALGYSWQLEVDAAKELLNLITVEYEGNICVFEHTVGEIKGALAGASESLKRGEQIFDLELRTYAELKKCNAFDFDLYSVTVRDNIEKVLKFRIQPPVNWSNEDAVKHNLDWQALSGHISDKHPNWKKRAVYNDISSVNYINILRKGDYTVKFGGKKRLPVFITSNTALVSEIRQYIGDAEWSVDALPIISDSAMICRLWLPKAQILTAVPALTLARDAFAAQQANGAFYEKVKTAAKELREKHNVDIINISEVIRIKLDEVIIRNIAGDIDSITPDLIAASVKEYVHMETAGLRKDALDLEEKNNLNKIRIREMQGQAIESAYLRFRNKAGLKRCLIWFSELWWAVNIIIFSAVGLFAGVLFFPLCGLVALPVKIGERVLGRPAVTGFLLKKSVPYVWLAYRNKVIMGLTDSERDTQNQILLLCRDNTPCFSRYQEYCRIGEV